MEDLRGIYGIDGLASMAEGITRALTARSRKTNASNACAQLAQSLGFDGLSYLLVRPAAVGCELIRHWTTAGQRWKLQYRKHAFHLVDPRVTLTVGRAAPVTWVLGAGTIEARGRAFAAAAATNGIGGGVAISMERPHGERAIVAWDSQVAPSSECRTGLVRSELAALALLACFLHDGLARERLPTDSGAGASSLTIRERECLSLAARGMTSADIAIKVGIAERTVNFHIGNSVRKLGALNRGEAIARGVALDLVQRPG